MATYPNMALIRRKRVLLHLTALALSLASAKMSLHVAAIGSGYGETITTDYNCGLDCVSQTKQHHTYEQQEQNSNKINYIDKLNTSFALASNSSSDPVHVKSIYLSLLDILSRMNQTLDNEGAGKLKEQADSLTAEANNVPISVRHPDGSPVNPHQHQDRKEKIQKRTIGYTTSKPSADPLNVDVFSDAYSDPYDQARQNVVELNKKKPPSTSYNEDFASSPELMTPKVHLDRNQPLQQTNYNINNNNQQQYTATTPLPMETANSGLLTQKQSSPWKPSGGGGGNSNSGSSSSSNSRYTSYELEQPVDNSLFSITSSPGQDHQQSSSSFVSSSIKDISGERPSENEPAEAARFNTMFQNFEKNEFPPMADQVDYVDNEQPTRLRPIRPPPPPMRNARRQRGGGGSGGGGHRRPIPFNNYFNSNIERARKPPSMFLGGGGGDFAKAPLRESAHLELEDYDGSGPQASKLSTNFGGDFNNPDEPLPPPPPPSRGSGKFNQGVYLQQVDTKPISSHYSFQYQPHGFSPAPPLIATQHAQQASHSQQQPQKVYYTLVPQTAYKTSSTTQAQVSSLLGQSGSSQPSAQPQTIQITAIPSGLGINNSPAVVRVNGLNNLGNNLPNTAGLIGGTGNSWLDPTGRQVLMVNGAERRLDWSWLVWPVAVVVALPLILSALFVPVFLKSMVIFIQILQSLGLVLPISSAINQHLAQGNVPSNITHHSAS